MYTLRLFHQSDPFRQIEARDIGAGEIAIGRDPGADWTILDPGRSVSRRHCVVAVESGALTLRDMSANGVFVDPGRRRLATGAPCPVATGETIRLGDYMIMVEARSFAPADRAEAAAFDAPFSRPILAEPPVDAGAVAAPSDWTAAAPAGPPPSDATLLDAFCAGARLDASLFAGEEPAVVMRRLGEAYQQMVLGLSDLMSERTSLKAGFRMDRTRVHAAGNNPFKWASGQRLATDLLRRGQEGFLPGPEAVGVSFSDLKKHLLCMLAGMRAAIAETLDELCPERVEADLETRSFRLKTRGQACWEDYVRRHAELRRQAAEDADGPLNRAFAAAYERRLHELDETGPGA